MKYYMYEYLLSPAVRASRDQLIWLYSVSLCDQAKYETKGKIMIQKFLHGLFLFIDARDVYYDVTKIR